jgi:hypothetical protein
MYGVLLDTQPPMLCSLFLLQSKRGNGELPVKMLSILARHTDAVRYTRIYPVRSFCRLPEKDGIGIELLSAYKPNLPKRTMGGVDDTPHPILCRYSGAGT